MAEDQETNGVGDEGGIADYDGSKHGNDINDSNDMIPTTTVPPVPIIDNGGEGNILPDDYLEEEKLPIVTVNLTIDDKPEGFVSEIVTTTITDEILNVETTTPLKDLIDNYTAAISQGISEQLNGIDTQGKQWWSPWNWHKALIVGLIGLCIIGIILALLFFILGKKFKNKPGKKSTVTGSETTKSVVSKGISRKSEYSPVPTSV